MLRIGNNNKGFTLMEIMITTAVLALGTVLIYEGFFMSLETFNYYFDYLNVVPWADEKIWDAQNELSRLGPQAKIETAGEFVNRNKNFIWNLTCGLLDETGGLYSVDLLVSWQEGKRKLRLARSAYAIYKKE